MKSRPTLAAHPALANVANRNLPLRIYRALEPLTALHRSIAAQLDADRGKR